MEVPRMSKQDAEEQAIAWAVLADAPDFADWEQLEQWLAADPQHAVLFDRAASQAHEAAKVIASVPARDRLMLIQGDRIEAVEDREPAPRRRWVPAGIAAGLGGLAIGTAWLLQPGPAPEQIVVTRAGEVRTLMLGDHSSVTLNGDSEVRFASGQPRALTLTRGQASFQVRHDASRPFTVTAGDVVVTDLGTRFDMDRAAGTTVVAVAEGEVALRAAGKRVDLRAGQSSIVPDGAAPAEPVPVAPEDVSGWQKATLNYEDATLARVVLDVTRRTGLRIRLAPGLAGRHFAGSINLAGSPDTVITRLEAVLGLAARRDGEGWTLAPGPDGQSR
jgi:transmembrane sensor